MFGSLSSSAFAVSLLSPSVRVRYRQQHYCHPHYSNICVTSNVHLTSSHFISLRIHSFIDLIHSSNRPSWHDDSQQPLNRSSTPLFAPILIPFERIWSHPLIVSHTTTCSLACCTIVLARSPSSSFYNHFRLKCIRSNSIQSNFNSILSRLVSIFTCALLLRVVGSIIIIHSNLFERQVDESPPHHWSNSLAFPFRNCRHD